MAEMTFEILDTVDRETKVNKENLNYEDVNFKPSDDSDIEIITLDDVEENTFIEDERSDHNHNLESLVTKDESSTDIEIINLSSDDEDATASKDNILDSKNEASDYASDSPESPDEQMEIEIEQSDGKKIKIKQNSLFNVDELILESDEECTMFDFSNYSADDILRAVENNNLLTDESVPHSVKKQEKITKNYLESKIKKPKISLTKIKTGLDTVVRNSTKSKSATEINSNNNISEISNDEIPEAHLVLKCEKCATVAVREINVNINAAKRCPKCFFNMRFQCKVCTCLFPTVFSITNHLKNYHRRENENVLQSIDNLHLEKVTLPRAKIKKKPIKVQKIPKVQKDKLKKRTIKCVRCPKKFSSLKNLQIHKFSCSDTIAVLYCRFCTLAILTVKELRSHLTAVHSGRINQSDLNQIVNGIEQEGLKILDMKSTLLVKCIACKCVHQLKRREKQCRRCKSSLMYKCGEEKCKLLFRTANELLCHVRERHLHTWHRCNSCGAAFTDCAAAARHRLQEHPEDRVSYRHCARCHYEATSPGDMTSHLLSAHGARSSTGAQPYEGPYICQACGKLFKLEYKYRMHQTSFCRKTFETYCCAHCRYKSVDKEKLLQHLQCCHVHLFTGRNFRCRRCGLEVASIYKLNSHLGMCKGSPALNGERSSVMNVKKVC